MTSKPAPAPEKPDDDAAAADAAAAEITLPLRKPIPVYTDKVSTLKLRRPTGSDLVQIGNPVIFDPVSYPPVVRHDMPRMCAMLARLADIPESSIERLEPEDLVAAAWAVSPFFIPMT
jgi:hypothetical protein